MRPMPKNECYGCKKRTLGCHSQCEAYKAYHEWWVEYRAESHAKATAHQTHQDSFRFKDGKLIRKR